jgi:hypothetical protein
MNWKKEPYVTYQNQTYTEEEVTQIIEDLISDAVAKSAIMGTDKAREVLTAKWLGKDSNES